MADIKPFRGIRYNPAVAGSLGLNVSPPFDMITPALQRDLYERSHYNIVRLELARRRLGGDPYTSAAESQRRWMGAGALTRDEEPSVYVTEESFSFRGNEYVRRGVIAAVRIEEYDRNVVLPHEYTRQEWVLDRVRLMGVAGYNYSSLLVLFRDDLRSTVGGILRAVAGGKPTATAAPPDMPELRMWRLSDPGTIEVLANSFADNQLFIADGHHRYEAALRFRSRVRSEREVDPGESINYRMMMLVSVSEPGLVTRGYHRTVQNASDSELSTITSLLRERTTLTKWGHGDATAATQFADSLSNMSGDEAVFGVYGLEKGVCHVARLEPAPPSANELERSEYSRLHELLFRQTVSPEREAEIVSFSYEPRAGHGGCGRRRGPACHHHAPGPDVGVHGHRHPRLASSAEGHQLPPKTIRRLGYTVTRRSALNYGLPPENPVRIGLLWVEAATLDAARPGDTLKRRRHP